MVGFGGRLLEAMPRMPLEEALVLFGDRLRDVFDEQGAIRAAAGWLGLDVPCVLGCPRPQEAEL
jgi:hypothetical protein